MQVGDLIKLYEPLCDVYSVGLVCDIEPLDPAYAAGLNVGNNRYWTMWSDGEYSWVCDKSETVVISESR